MTGLIDTLEKDRLVAREPDPHDRRTIHVRLTSEGRAVLDAMLPDYFQCVADILRPLSEPERKKLVPSVAENTGRAADVNRTRRIKRLHGSKECP